MTPTLFATLKYQDARKAMTWQADAFGLQLDNYSPESGDTVDHAEMFYGNGGIMFGSSGKPQRRESQLPPVRSSRTHGHVSSQTYRVNGVQELAIHPVFYPS